jgi:3-oxoacyl-[acyl-carrier protein] reductase
MKAVFAADCLEGRTALVTGASSGIGAACARQLAQLGAKVIISGRSHTRLQQVAEGFDQRMLILPIDLASPEAPERLASEVQAAVGSVDIIVHSAGFGQVVSSKRITAQSVDEVFAVNVRAPLLLSSRLAPSMLKAGWGSIINISSVVASLGTPYQAAYSATKGALESMTRALAREYGSAGVRVNAVAPGLIATEMWGTRLDDRALVDEAAKYTALNVWGTPEMIADVVVFLASDASRYITGQVLLVDGGHVSTGDLVPPAFFGRPTNGS